jgi:hypothetical protein
MKPQEKTHQSGFDIQRVTTPRAMALAVVLASAATMLLNAAINAERGAALPENIAAPARNAIPHAPEGSPPRAIPVRHIAHAHARL